MKIVLAIETSCDETAMAILRNGELLASEVASQVAEHEKFGGVVPEVASRNHLVHVPRLLERTANAARIAMVDIDAFAATSGPGLASSLMIGASVAPVSMSLQERQPFLPHQQSRTVVLRTGPVRVMNFRHDGAEYSRRG